MSTAIKKRTPKCQLTAEIRAAMMPEKNLKALAKEMRVSWLTIRNQVKNHAPTLCYPQYVKAIRGVLKLGEDKEVYEIIDPEVLEKHLHCD